MERAPQEMLADFWYTMFKFILCTKKSSYGIRPRFCRPRIIELKSQKRRKEYLMVDGSLVFQ